MDERATRNALVVGAVVLALLSIASGALIALSGDEEPPDGPSPTTAGTTDEPSDVTSVAPDPTMPTSPQPSTGESPVLEDGRHFAFVKVAVLTPGGSTRVRFDLAYFLTGAEGEQAAEDHGDEFVNGYYIVNDNPRLRTLPLADEVEVEYIPAARCCELQPGDIDAWVASIDGTNPTDYAGTEVPWWLTVEGGQITRIEQQYLP
jgi:hypothetical protein